MKLFIITALAALTAAAPNPAGIAENAVSQELTWTGDVQDGTGNTTFTGTAESIWVQILTANPEFVSGDVPEAPKTVLSKRAGADSYDCNRFPDKRTPSSQTIDQLNYLYRIRGTCGLPGGAGQCSRVSCSYNSGIWACSRIGAIGVPCADIADISAAIVGRCTTNGQIGANAVRGDYFTDVHSDKC